MNIFGIQNTFENVFQMQIIQNTLKKKLNTFRLKNKNITFLVFSWKYFISNYIQMIAHIVKKSIT